MAWINHRQPTEPEIRTFGPNVRISPLTDRPLEDGYGALPDDVQEWQQTSRWTRRAATSCAKS